MTGPGRRTASALATWWIIASCSAAPERPLTPRRSEPRAPPSSALPSASAIASADAGAPEASVAPPPWDFGGPRQTPREAGNLCEPAISNLERAQSAILAAPRPKPVKRSGPGWNRAQPPKYLDRLRERFALTQSELALLEKNGFVVLARDEQSSYADAFHEIYQSQLPLFVSVDAVLHAVFHGHDSAVAELEQNALVQAQADALDAMHAALPAKAGTYPSEIAKDVDVYLAVARSLAHNSLAGAKLGTDAKVKSLVEQAHAAEGFSDVELFGRRRMIDFSRYRPRGRYAKHDALGPYFRAATWLANLELNLVSRGGRSSAPGFVPDPSETPREALVALALADLAERSGAAASWARIDATWSTLGGVREDVSLSELNRLRKSAAIARLDEPDAFDRLKAAIGSNYARTTRVHYMPQGSRPLPAIATVLGPRITADTTALAGLVHGDVDQRFEIRAGDVGFVLGHDLAKSLLTSQLTRYPALDAQLKAGRAALAKPAQSDLYSAWLDGVRALAELPEGTTPSFTSSRAFSALRLNSALVGYGQLRHSYVLIAGQAYDEGGCVIPDGYVDPAPAVYSALMRYAKQGAALAQSLGSAEIERYFTRLATRLSVLEAIALQQLSGEPPAEETRRWFSMVAEILPPSSEGPGSYDGWYFEMFRNRHEALESPAFIADFYKSSNSGKVTHLGASSPRLALFVVDVGGEPRVMVGPVARGFELIAARRVTDAGKFGSDPWARQYTAPAPPIPRVAIRILDVKTVDGRDHYEIAVRASGGLTVDLLDHHRQLIASGTTRSSKLVIAVPSGSYPEGVRLRSGTFSHFAPLRSGPYLASVRLGGASEIEAR